MGTSFCLFSSLNNCHRLNAFRPRFCYCCLLTSDLTRFLLCESCRYRFCTSTFLTSRREEVTRYERSDRVVFRTSSPLSMCNRNGSFCPRKVSQLFDLSNATGTRFSRLCNFRCVSLKLLRFSRHTHTHTHN